MDTNRSSYTLDIDKGARLVRTTLRGQWTLGDVEGYDRERSVLLKASGWQSGTFAYLADLRETGVQPMEVASAQQEALGRMPITPRRVAVIVPSALARMQAKRMNDHPDRRFFSDEPAALAWLVEGGSRPA